MRGAMSRLAAATLVAICLSMLPSPLHATRGLHQKKATAAKVKSHSGAGASSASSLGRLLAYDLPLPHDWIRQSESSVGAASYSYSYSFSFNYSPTPSPTTNPTTIPVLAPTVQDPPTVGGQPGDIPIVSVQLSLAGSPEQQEDVTEALTTYLTEFAQGISGARKTTEVPEPITRHRLLQSVPAPVGRLCTPDAPQAQSSIDLRDYSDVLQVQQILASIMDGTIVLTAVQDDGTKFSVKDLICSVEVTLRFESPPLPPTGLIPIVQILLILAGTPQQQDEAIAALIAYLIAYMQRMSGENVVVLSPEAPEPINRHRILELVPAPGRLCTTDAPQNETSIECRNYDDVGQVQEILAGIMNGTIVLPPVQDSICSAKTTLSFVPPPTDTLDDKSNVKDGPKPLSPVYIALIAVAGVTVLFAAIFLARRHMAPKPRSAVVASS